MSTALAIVEVGAAVVDLVDLRRRAAIDRTVKREVKREASRQIQRRQIEAVEDALIKALMPMFKAQIEEAADRLEELSGKGVEIAQIKSVSDAANNLADQTINPSEWDGELTDIVFPILAKSMGQVAAATLLEVGIDVRKSVVVGTVKSTASEWLASHGEGPPPGVGTEFPDWMKDAIGEQLEETFEQNYWLEIHKTTRNDIARFLDTGIKEGLSIRDMARQITTALGLEPGGDPDLDYARIRAMRIARTESKNALSGARDISINALKEEMGEAGRFVSKSWLSVLGATTRDAHAGLDGVLADENGLFNLNGVFIPWPAHVSLPPGDRINCFIGSTLISGQIEACTRARYEGRFWEIITATGRRLTATPNHPILTPSGFIPIGEIEVGQQVLSAPIEVNSASAVNVAGHNVNHKPIQIQDMFESFTSGPSRSRMVELRRVTVNDFYGDALNFIGEIETALPFISDQCGVGFDLGEKIDSVQDQKSFDEDFILTIGTGHTGSGPSRFVGRHGPSSDLFGSSVLPASSLAFGVAADLDLPFVETAYEHRSREIVLVTQLQERNPGLVFLDDVVEIGDFNAFHNVYCPQTVTGLVVANGIIAKQCQCSIVMELGVGAPEEEIQAIMAETTL